jgi:hypothetical protein
MACICSNCVSDKILSAIVEEEGLPGFCEECQEEQPTTIDSERIAEKVAPLIQEFFEPGGDMPIFYGDSDNIHYEQDGEDLDFIIQLVLGQTVSFQDELLEVVLDTEEVDISDGGIPFLSNEVNYVEKPISSAEYWFDWKQAQKEIGHHRRFFSASAKRLFDELFTDIDKMLTQDAPRGEKPRIVRMLPVGTQIFRSRHCDSDDLLRKIIEQPYSEVGPPPPHKARPGRMNAQGIPVFYGALTASTTLAELRPALGSETATITLSTTRELRLLDFTRMKSAYKSLSYFQGDYSQQAARFSFIRSLARLISRPIVPGNEHEYLITQALMEYLAYVHNAPFDGVLFSSAQDATGTNIVIFPTTEYENYTFPITYVDGSLHFSKTTKVQYKHISLKVEIINGKPRKAAEEEER